MKILLFIVLAVLGISCTQQKPTATVEILETGQVITVDGFVNHEDVYSYGDTVILQHTQGVINNNPHESYTVWGYYKGRGIAEIFEDHGSENWVYREYLIAVII